MTTPRQFALEVVQTLQQSNYEALWAGGCVRDQLLNRKPKDYDVATSATPEQVRQVFGKKRTLPIGAAFGVISVLGPKSAGPIEVATFRRDGGYSDGRRPDSVEYTDAREDALRRDFTINGMFFDPINETVIDYVGGKEDLAAQQIRAIGNPHERIEEDKLRMLRGVRFAATYGFELESSTLSAIQQHANEIDAVSGERIGAEMRRMLASRYRQTAVELLRESQLLEEIIPDFDLYFTQWSAEDWETCETNLARLDSDDFSSAAAILLQMGIEKSGIEPIANRWKLSNDEKRTISWVCKHWQTLDRSDELPWSIVQPMLLNQDVNHALNVATAIRGETSPGILLCRERLKWPQEKLDPVPLLDGGDLIRLNVKRGPQFKTILNQVRAAQLDGQISTVAEAEIMAVEIGS